MRDILKKATTGAMIAGAALLVAACGSETTTENTNVTDMSNDTMLDANATDMGMDMNATDMNATSTDMNATSTDMNATSTDANASTETTNAQ